jgi:hypothetical protein
MRAADGRIYTGLVLNFEGEEYAEKWQQLYPDLPFPLQVGLCVRCVLEAFDVEPSPPGPLALMPQG